jgi:hypothetical protein
VAFQAGTHRAQQEREAKGFQFTWAGVQGPNVDNYGVIQTRIVTTQEMPWHPASRLLAGIQGPDVRPPVSDRIHTRQELPDHPASRFVAGIQGPNVKVPVRDAIFIRQELPNHPASRLWAGLQQQSVVRPPVADRILALQELPHYPTHPQSRFWPGIQGPNVAPPPQIRNRIHTVQELPWHPASLLISAPPPVLKQIPFVGVLRTVQERPWHPGSFFHAGTHPVSYEDIEFFVIN